MPLLTGLPPIIATSAANSHLRRAWAALVAMCLALLLGASARAADDFLPPEQAFKVTAAWRDAGRVEVLVRIAPGYYLYREPFRFDADHAQLGPADIPPGKVKFDENFQKNVETYRGDLRITVPVSAVTAAFRLGIVSQGCADAGLCYPPMRTEVALEAAPPQGGGTLAARAGPSGWLARHPLTPKRRCSSGYCRAAGCGRWWGPSSASACC